MERGYYSRACKSYLYIGEISNQGTVLYDQDKCDYYINKQETLDSADKNAIYVLLPNGESIRLENRKNLFMNYNDSNLTIYPGSVIFVPRKLNVSISEDNLFKHMHQY